MLIQIIMFHAHKCLSKRILHTCNSSSQELHIPPGFRGTYKHWTDLGLSKALKDIDKGLSIRKVSDMYGIPRSTLHDHVSGKVVETRRQNSRLFLLFKIIHNQSCIPLTDMTPPTIITSSTTSTRSDINNLSVPFARTDTYKFSFGPHACNIWNNLPSHIKEVTSIDTFKILIDNL